MGKHIINLFLDAVAETVDVGIIRLLYINGTKIDSRAHKDTFVWRKTVERNRAKLMDKIRVLLEEVNESIAQENFVKDLPVEFTPAILSEIVDELKNALEHEPQASDKEQKKVHHEKKKKIKELQVHHDKLAEYEHHLEIMGRL